MADVLPFPGRGPNLPATADPSQEAAAQFQTQCFERFNANSSARGHSTLYVRRVLNTMTRLLQWTGKYVFEIQEADYEAWCEYLATEAKCAQSTRRTYQNAVRKVVAYLCDATDLQNEAQRLFGARITRFAHADNSIAHRVEDESAAGRNPMTHEEIQTLFDSIDARIECALNEKPREYAALARDKALIFILYQYGLRASEVGALQFRDWSADPANPECDRYALLRVRFGKAARGSGKRHRTVPSTDPDIVELVDWYRTEIRPLFKVQDALTNTVFLSERGGPISGSSIHARFAKHLQAAGLGGRGHSPHSLRHSMVTHEVMRSGPEFARAMAGHASAHTTSLYTNVPKEHMQARVQSIVNDTIAAAKRGEQA